MGMGEHGLARRAEHPRSLTEPATSDHDQVGVLTCGHPADDIGRGTILVDHVDQDVAPFRLPLTNLSDDRTDIGTRPVTALLQEPDRMYHDHSTTHRTREPERPVEGGERFRRRVDPDEHS